MRNILLIAIGALILLELTKKNKATDTTTPTTAERSAVERNKVKVSGFYPSSFPDARPENPYQVRWGGNRFLDTTKKVQLAI